MLLLSISDSTLPPGKTQTLGANDFFAFDPLKHINHFSLFCYNKASSWFWSTGMTIISFFFFRFINSTANSRFTSSKFISFGIDALLFHVLQKDRIFPPLRQYLFRL